MKTQITTKGMRVDCYSRKVTNRVWLYCRVAGSEQFVLHMQEQQLKKFAEAHGWTVIGITSEQCNGNTIIRDGLTEIGTVVLNGEVDTILAVNMNRICRTVSEGFLYWEFLRKHHVSLHTITEGEIDLSIYRDLYNAFRAAMTQ